MYSTKMHNICIKADLINRFEVIPLYVWKVLQSLMWSTFAVDIVGFFFHKYDSIELSYPPLYSMLNKTPPHTLGENELKFLVRLKIGGKSYILKNV